MAPVQVVAVDAERALRTWLNDDTTLCGRGRPVTNGFHHGDIRSPASGTWGRIDVLGHNLDDAVDAARFSLVLKAVGRPGPEAKGPRGDCELAARSTAVKVFGVCEETVTLDDGSRVVLKSAGDGVGPTPAGDVGGEVTYRVDVTIHMQPA